MARTLAKSVSVIKKCPDSSPISALAEKRIWPRKTPLGQFMNDGFELKNAKSDAISALCFSHENRHARAWNNLSGLIKLNASAPSKGEKVSSFGGGSDHEYLTVLPSRARG